MQVQLEHSYKAAQVDSNTPSRLSKTSECPKIGPAENWLLTL